MGIRGLRAGRAPSGGEPKGDVLVGTTRAVIGR